MKPWKNGFCSLGVSFGLIIFPVMMTTGCGGRATGTVTGTVTYKGEKVPSAKVTFYGPDDKTATTSTDGEGAYKAVDVPLGLVKVTVTTSRPGPSAERAAKNPMLQKKGYVPSSEKSVAIPPKYSDPLQTNISLTVIEGSQPFDIELK
jgi:hypothetical protein